VAIQFTISNKHGWLRLVSAFFGAVVVFIGLDAFAQTAIPPPPTPPTLLLPVPPAPLRPIGRSADWATDNDYPTRALQLNEAGVAGFKLTVDQTGTPIACEITATTNSAQLDQTTCDLMMQRARFLPATDAAGKPITAFWLSSVRWGPILP
jgi:protein TonB